LVTYGNTDKGSWKGSYLIAKMDDITIGTNTVRKKVQSNA
jgi:hypothetical protein